MIFFCCSDSFLNCDYIFTEKIRFYIENTEDVAECFNDNRHTSFLGILLKNNIKKLFKQLLMPFFWGSGQLFILIRTSISLKDKCHMNRFVGISFNAPNFC